MANRQTTPKRPVAEALARATEPLEVIPEFPAPKHAPLCNIANGEDCDCGIADAIGPDPVYNFATAKPESCGATSPWLTHCIHEVEHNGSHSWQDQDRFPLTASTSTEVFTPLRDAEEVWADKPAIRQAENGKWDATELALPGMQSVAMKGSEVSTSAAPVTMVATLKRLGYKSGTQADPDAYVEMVIRTNDLSVGAELGWQTGKTLSVTMQPEQPRLPSSENGDETDGEA